MKVLLLNQCFHPDVVATSQQLTDLARGLQARGHQVTVIVGRRGYDDPTQRFPSRERWHDIDIIRVPAISLGKASRWRRALNFGSFLAACAARLAVLPRQDVVVALTSPPLISWLASLFIRLKGGRLVFWVMDLNPDEAIAAGWLRRDSLLARLLESLLKSSMRHSERIIVLDRFVKERVRQKGIEETKIEIIPPWSHDQSVRFDSEGRQRFRRGAGLDDKFVVMYAGNHSPCHPLESLLGAAVKLREREDIAFCFVGGGSKLRDIMEFAGKHRLENIRYLPYQPLSELSGVLSAADLHVVALGESFPGILHPSKIYNILAVGSPFLYIGPAKSHMGDIIDRLADSSLGYRAAHDDVEAVVSCILERSKQHSNADSRSETPSQVLANEFSQGVLMPRFIDHVEEIGAKVQGSELSESARSSEFRVNEVD